uniref:HSF-type DNA-binding domain-containing protein n=2 Tax=Phaeomonas parva TaxID=124430 RepID=A0A7S1XRR5_9STRA|mmetsp:Transcript_27180/g.85516  ORF Transcript_27180/g.85516 Transcript_27180/m.85516 type:complete len:252 (+) Transcript_27180:124-879(+)
MRPACIHAAPCRDGGLAPAVAAASAVLGSRRTRPPRARNATADQGCARHLALNLADRILASPERTTRQNVGTAAAAQTRRLGGGGVQTLRMTFLVAPSVAMQAAVAMGEERGTKRARPSKGKGFPAALRELMDDPASRSVVEWSKDGRRIVVINRLLLEQRLAPRHFAHSNFSSFMRQLNSYGFHKCIGLGVLCAYEHPEFTRDSRENDHLLRRRKPKNKRVRKKKSDDNGKDGTAGEGNAGGAAAGQISR